MAIGAAVGIGAGMAAAGAGTAGAGLAVKGTGPKKQPYNYGGSADAAQAYRDQYGRKVGLAETLANGSVPLYDTLAKTGQAAQQQGVGTLAQALAPGGFGGEGGANLSYFDPGAVARAQSAATIAENARVTNAMGRSGGALGLRTALNANASAGVQAANQAAVTAAQGEQVKAQMAVQNQQLINALRMGMAGVGQQQQAFGAGVQSDVAGQVANMGLTREGLYNSALSGMEAQQLEAQIAAEKARQEAQIDKRRLIVGLGAGLLGAGGQVMASGMGGK